MWRSSAGSGAGAGGGVLERAEEAEHTSPGGRSELEDDVGRTLWK